MFQIDPYFQNINYQYNFKKECIIPENYLTIRYRFFIRKFYLDMKIT